VWGEDTIWIFDSYSKGCVKLCGRERGLTKVSVAYPPSFYMHLSDPTGHMDIFEGLESRYKVEDCAFRTIYGAI
jgi:DNA polymerase, archaea type